jgi:hypothetical protein
MINHRLPKDNIDARRLELEIYREFDNHLKDLEKELMFLKLYLLKIITIRKNIRDSKWYLIKFIFNAKFSIIYTYLKHNKKVILDFWKVKEGIKIAKQGLEEMNKSPLTQIIKKYNETQS